MNRASAPVEPGVEVSQCIFAQLRSPAGGFSTYTAVLMHYGLNVRYSPTLKDPDVAQVDVYSFPLNNNNTTPQGFYTGAPPHTCAHKPIENMLPQCTMHMQFQTAHFCQTAESSKAQKLKVKTNGIERTDQQLQI